MKRIKLSVTALAIATSGFGQCVRLVHTSKICPKYGKEVRIVAKDSILLAKLEIENTAEDMIEWIHQDIENDKIHQEYAEMYIYNLKVILANVRKLRENE